MVQQSGVLIAWGDPPRIISDSFNPYDPQHEKRDDELKMELKYMIPFMTFLGMSIQRIRDNTESGQNQGIGLIDG